MPFMFQWWHHNVILKKLKTYRQTFENEQNLKPFVLNSTKTSNEMKLYDDVRFVENFIVSLKYLTYFVQKPLAF